MACIAMSIVSMAAFSQETWDAKKNPTVEAITSQYSGKYIAPRAAVTTNDIFPAIGKYQSANSEATTLTVSLDEANKGIVWIEGLPQGKIKAMLRKSPATYKIPAQKTESGKDVAEGTLVFDKESNTLNIAIGKTYDAENPSSVFTAEEIPAETPKASKAKTKKPVKSKIWIYTATKLTNETAGN